MRYIGRYTDVCFHYQKLLVDDQETNILAQLKREVKDNWWTVTPK